MMVSNEKFSYAVNITLSWEGGYSNDPNDSGGETNFGISKAAYPDIDIRNLTRDQAIALYHRDYWLPLGLDRFQIGVAAKIFDLAVNMGIGSAIKVVQAGLNRLPNTPTLVVDGKLGPMTATVIENAPPAAALREIRNQASLRYIRIADAHPSDSKYLQGWLRRARA